MSCGFLEVRAARLAELRQPIGLVIAYATQKVTEPMIFDNSITPRELVAALLDAHALGLASAVAAAIHDDTGISDIGELRAAVIQRFDAHLSEVRS